MSNWLDGYKILDAKAIEERAKKIREARKLQRIVDEEYLLNQKKDNSYSDNKQDSSRR